MDRKRNKRLWPQLLPIALMPAFLLGGCSLLPAEDVGGHVVLVQTESAPDYELAQVMRGDVELTQTVYCVYTQTHEENLSFGTDGRRVQFVYVKVGDSVKEGDLLAKLYTDDLESSLDEQTYQVERTTLLLAQTNELKDYELSVARQEFENGRQTAAQYEEREQQIENSYASSIRNYEDELYIAGLRVEALTEQLAGCFIYAGFDGVITMVRNDLQSRLSSAGTTAMTLTDSSQCAFRSTDVKYADYFKAGQEVVLEDNSSGKQYVTEVLPAADAPDSEYLYFALKELDLELTAGTRAFVTLTFDSRENVLMLPAIVVHSADGKNYVYREDESGLKTMQFITTGLVGNSYVEVLDGLDEGDIVIKR